jgi:signal transduction histidine kinase
VKGGWRRHDTLALRLFVLMAVTLVASHLAAFLAVVPGDGPGAAGGSRLANLPTLTSLPPGGLVPAQGPVGGGPISSPPAPPPPNAHGPGAAPLGAPPGPPPDGPGGPGGPVGAPGGPEGPPGPTGTAPPALPAGALWLDYLIRFTVIAIGAAIGARWLARPMKRLAQASTTLAQGLVDGRAPPQLDERHGTAEVRETAQVFNHMARRLAEQFDTRSLHMAAISHDLRTPLTRLRMRLELLHANEAIADVHEMDQMIGDALAVLREQRDDVPAEPVDLAALVQALVDDLADQGLDATAPSLPAARVRAHPAALRRVIGNLLGNALRYGQRARVHIAPAGRRVALWIDDDGPGIPPAQVEQAFRPWQRLAGAEGHPSGHGLGLAIARDLAERDGATLTLANRPEGGLRAQLDLPAA